MATRVRLYYTERNTNKWELLANKLLIVEDIEAYLNTKTFLNITNFQYIKNELELAINVQITQTYSQPKTSTNFKYVAIQNENELVHYYFVKKAYWRSKDCVRFELVMDVLNTFQEGQDYSFKATTKITREHKDRFVLDESFEATFNFQITEYEGTISEGDMVAIVDEEVLLEGVVTALGSHSITLGNLNKTPAQIREDIPVPSEYRIAKTPDIYILADIDSIDFEGSYFRNIDYISENINPVLENVDRKIIRNPVTLLEQDWYLLYRNQEDPDQSLVNPVDCYLIPNNAGLQVDAGAILGGRLIPSFIEDNKYYYFRVDSGQTYTLSNGQSISYSSNPNKYVIVTKVDNKINVIFAEVLVSSSGSILTIVGNYDVDYITITSLPAYYAKLNGGNFSALILGNLSYNNVFENTLTYNTLDDITKLDRTDAKNIKLIKLPYCPYNFSIVNDVLKIDQEADWELSSITQANGGIIYALKLLKLNKKLSNNFNSFPNPLLNLSSFLPNNAAITDLRITNLDIESKLFHSDFRRDTFVYDSFSWTLPLEKLSLTYYITGSRIFNIKFNTTSTINSKFMFTFTPFVSTKAIENFPNVLTIARNNEEVLYNVPYINYIRTGYNYEIKAKSLSNASNLAGVGLSVGSAFAALAFPSAPLKVAGVVASLVSVAMSVKNTITSALSNENTMQQKMDQLRNQATSVSGSDDVDLMSVYCGNRLQWLLYEPNQLMKNLLFDLFFYAGYNSGRMGLPNHNTRINFDYLECDASFESVSSIPEECLNELIGCFKNGVTYLHKTNRSSDKWDFEQKYENWERSIIGE